MKITTYYTKANYLGYVHAPNIPVCYFKTTHCKESQWLTAGNKKSARVCCAFATFPLLLLYLEHIRTTFRLREWIRFIYSSIVKASCFLILVPLKIIRHKKRIIEIVPSKYDCVHKSSLFY